MSHTITPANRHGTRALAALLLVVAPLAWPTSARAGEPADDIEDLTLDDLLNLSVDTASRRAQPFVWTPSTSIIVTRDEIRDRHYVNLRDLLQDLPGVDVYRNFNEILPELVSFRGNVGNNNFIILRNGQRISSPTGEPLPIDDNYPLFDAKQVEVIFGPASALYGADALSGVINIVTLDDVTPRGLKASASYGANRYVYGTVNAHANLFGRLQLQLGGHFHRSDNSNLAADYPDDFPTPSFHEFRDPFTGALLPGDRTDTYSNASSSYSLQARARLDGKLTVGYDLRRFNMQTSADNRPQYVVYGGEAQFIQQTMYADHTDRLAPNLEVANNLAFSIVEYGPDFVYRNYYSDFKPVWKHMNNQTFTYNNRLSWDLSARHNLVGGFQWSQTESAPYSIDLQARPDPNRPLSAQGFKIPGTDLPAPFYDIRYRTLGGFLQMQSQWLPRLSTTVGVRYDHDSRYGSTVNPRVSAVFQITPDYTTKLMYGEAYLAPSTTDQYDTFGTFNGVDPATGKPHADFYHLPNPDLKPVKARTVELNETMVVAKKLMIVASGYYSRLDGMLVNVFSTGRTDFAGGIVDGVETSQSLGRAQLYGGSISGSYRGRIGRLHMDPWASYTLSLGRNDDGPGTAEHALYYNTPHKVKGGVTLRFGKAHLTPRFRYIGETAHPGVDTISGHTDVRVAPSTVVDATFLVTELPGGFALSADARNILDRRYYSAGYAGATEFPLSPQETRQIMFTLSFGY